MLRSFFIALSKASWAQDAIVKWGVARRASRRFVAGETVEDAVAAVKVLNGNGILATLDHLGENTKDRNDAENSTSEILALIQTIEETGIRSNISIKLSQIGLSLDEDLCRENLGTILDRARKSNNFIRIDMEDSTLTQKTVNAFLWAREHGFENVGLVIQSYLFRSMDDILTLAKSGSRIRLCKGAYKEPAQIAFPQKSDVDNNYDRLVDVMYQSIIDQNYPVSDLSGKIPPILAIASQDEARIQHAIEASERLNIPKNCFEFQMLYGIRRNLQEDLVKKGYQMRVYVPYGTRWYPYFMRRLAERPANVWFFISNFFRK